MSIIRVPLAGEILLTPGLSGENPYIDAHPPGGFRPLLFLLSSITSLLTLQTKLAGCLSLLYRKLDF